MGLTQYHFGSNTVKLINTSGTKMSYWEIPIIQPKWCWVDRLFWFSTLTYMLKRSAKGSLKSSESRIRSSITDLARHMTTSIGTVRGDIGKLRTEVKSGFEDVHIELEAIKELVVVRKELRNLVRELKTQGVVLDESRIFAA